MTSCKVFILYITYRMTHGPVPVHLPVKHKGLVPHSKTTLSLLFRQHHTSSNSFSLSLSFFFCMFSVHGGRGRRRNVGLQTMRLCASVFAHETVHSMPVSLRHQIVQQRVDGGAEVEEHRRHQVDVLRQVVEEILGVGVRAVKGHVVFCGAHVLRCHGNLIRLFTCIRICLRSRGGEARVSTGACADALAFCKHIPGGLVTLPLGVDHGVSGLRWVLQLNGGVDVEVSVKTQVGECARSVAWVSVCNQGESENGPSHLERQPAQDKHQNNDT